MDRADFGILGAGLAGVLLAHALIERGSRVVMADDSLPNAASPMAPGIINPLAGRRLKVNAGHAEAHARTIATFHQLEQIYGEPLWHPMPLLRLLENAAQREELEERRSAPEGSRWIGRIFAPGAHGSALNDPSGSFETLHAGWLDVPRLVALARDHLSFVETEALEASAERIIDCRGWRCSKDPHWKQLPWKCARGEVLTLELEGKLPRHLWNGGGWLQPLPGGSWRAGATYSWSGFESAPSATARAEIVTRLQRWLRLPFRILDQQVGVRSTVVDYRPLLGRRPDDPRRYLFSGLGSHGAIQGPPYAALLANHLLHGQTLPADVDIARFER